MTHDKRVFSIWPGFQVTPCRCSLPPPLTNPSQLPLLKLSLALGPEIVVLPHEQMLRIEGPMGIASVVRHLVAEAGIFHD